MKIGQVKLPGHAARARPPIILIGNWDVTRTTSQTKQILTSVAYLGAVQGTLAWRESRLSILDKMHW